MKINKQAKAFTIGLMFAGVFSGCNAPQAPSTAANPTPTPTSSTSTNQTAPAPGALVMINGGPLTSSSGSKVQAKVMERFFTNKTASNSSAFEGESVVCTTLTTPPVTGTGTVDASGNFSVQIAAQGNAVTCFLNLPITVGSNITTPVPIAVSSQPGANSQDTPANTSNTFSVGLSNVVMGPIDVDTINDIAQTGSVPEGVTQVVSTPPGLPCGVGEWVTTQVNFDYNCASGSNPVPSLPIAFPFNNGATFTSCANNPAPGATCTCTLTDGSYCTATAGANGFQNCVVKTAGIVGNTIGQNSSICSGNQANNNFCGHTQGTACADVGVLSSSLVFNTVENADGSISGSATQYGNQSAQNTCVNQHFGGAQIAVSGNILTLKMSSPAGDVDLSEQLAMNINNYHNFYSSAGMSVKVNGSGSVSNTCTSCSAGTCTCQIGGYGSQQGAPLNLATCNVDFTNYTQGSITITGFSCTASTSSGVAVTSATPYVAGTYDHTSANPNGAGAPGNSTWTFGTNNSPNIHTAGTSTLPSSCSNKGVWAGTYQGTLNGCSGSAPNMAFAIADSPVSNSGCAMCMTTSSDYAGGGSPAEAGCIGCGNIDCSGYSGGGTVVFRQ